MGELFDYTPTELLKAINDINVKHESLKLEIINHSIEIDDIEEIIKNKLTVLDELEKTYIILIEEINNR